MKKPWWVRLLGWFSIALFALSALGLYSYVHGNDTQAVALLCFAFFAAGTGMAVVWAIMSMFVWGVNRQARTSAAVMRDALAGGAPAAARREYAPASRAAPVARPGSVVPLCVECKTPAVLHCCRHEANLCWQHVGAHDSDECTYIHSWRVVPHAARQEAERRRVATSPLSGAR